MSAADGENNTDAVATTPRSQYICSTPDQLSPRDGLLGEWYCSSLCVLVCAHECLGGSLQSSIVSTRRALHAVGLASCLLCVCPGMLAATYFPIVPHPNTTPTNMCLLHPKHTHHKPLQV